MKILGVDLGTRKIAAAMHEGGLAWTDAYEVPESEMRHVRLLSISDWLYETVKHTDPDHVFIEDTLVGNNVKYSIQLAQVMGACLSSLALLQAEVYLGIYLVNNKTWKKEVVGNGNAGKDLIRSWVNGQDSAYAALCGDDQDRYDAACISYYGALIHERSEVLYTSSER